ARTLLLPVLEIERVTAHVHHAVDRGGAAEHLAARGVQAAAVEMRLGLGPVAPVVALHVHRDRERTRHLDPQRAVRAAVLEQQHAVAAVLAQAIGEHAAGRAGADDHVVERFHGNAAAVARCCGCGTERQYGASTSPSATYTLFSCV